MSLKGKPIKITISNRKKLLGWPRRELYSKKAYTWFKDTKWRKDALGKNREWRRFSFGDLDILLERFGDVETARSYPFKRKATNEQTPKLLPRQM